MPFNLPIALTWLRVAAIPLLVAVFYLPTNWLSPAEQNLIATLIFISAAVTDWLDGFLARRMKQESAFGQFLDPVADKLIVAASLLVLLNLDRVQVWVALVIIGREITISALREWMALLGAGKSVAVHMVGKLKTTAQLIAIPFLLFNDTLFGWLDCARVGTWLIWVASFLTLWSMFYYLKKALPQLAEKTE
ncbi:CDP-diacylglycerol--glycerol-3-phosphate 3-phosphatidyltransferase [Polynucleobacter sphagniphilus]|jgi:CDP-diacylglycerol--glycerol-3-phosphate 3-phosphatidyltransferase/cardiolipin synthase|uniref:CDP-diacylglycerol--glycerol-3-phosphate 3-phosphatidyltransferase n=1 Tax=Polynucleobacter sphagniphilus TaxID=1743169 RepID=A0AA43M709_9BURK|nr:CDP-diacylglycerol--glycerol-3-phosphate 3-phosphatidyltransferase [Polynucleobacter sphagniphilus]MDF9787450.1 CDP-diacylglycerol--glycerol-3-phosphate 3-phosphatidyltransferase [Polynucleobacter sphagniphilus]MDH6154175.1 CDP-diacylglycerol--glycerol-3-phosphate 3-phosphatidyltransferase [Polynucleobacter sphagniphilus]MDH6240449.1 CDP-diacylglycerol--glycerol-3-phosphate 3-phosphatidyltransferase [Polynucleobacter sphagniphilus]MDH6299827.1 CDP-diacylglycerol--glycerol-3-phosphate 3-phosp